MRVVFFLYSVVPFFNHFFLKPFSIIMDCRLFHCRTAVALDGYCLLVKRLTSPLKIPVRFLATERAGLKLFRVSTVIMYLAHSQLFCLYSPHPGYICSAITILYSSSSFLRRAYLSASNSFMISLCFPNNPCRHSATPCNHR